MSIIETIRNRKSCRTFNFQLLSSEDKTVLEDYIKDISSLFDSEDVGLRIIEKKDTSKTMKLDYGMLRGHNTYLLGSSSISRDSRVNYGYIVEKVVLKAAEIGVSSCWVGYFDNRYFNEINIEGGFVIPSIVILGYSKDKTSSFDKFVRYTVNGSKRLGWDRLFFNYHSQKPLTSLEIDKYADSLEMVRLAPSSGNTQPWRVFFDDGKNEFHFFKKVISQRYELKGLHDVDMGIGLSHFELTTLNNGLLGNWMKHENNDIKSIDDLQYIITWVCN